MSYRLISSNDIATKYPEVNDMPCIYADLPNGMDGEHYVLEQQPKILDTLDFAIDASNGDTSYFVGFRNALRYSKSLIDGEVPQFEHCTEQEPKTGHWIEKMDACECPYCHKAWDYCDNDTEDFDYCPKCGAKLSEIPTGSESNRTCHTCKHYTSGEYDGSCGSYICEHYSNWESEDKG